MTLDAQYFFLESALDRMLTICQRSAHAHQAAFDLDDALLELASCHANITSGSDGSLEKALLRDVVVYDLARSSLDAAIVALQELEEATRLALTTPMESSESRSHTTLILHLVRIFCGLVDMISISPDGEWQNCELRAILERSQSSIEKGGDKQPSAASTTRTGGDTEVPQGPMIAPAVIHTRLETVLRSRPMESSRRPGQVQNTPSRYFLEIDGKLPSQSSGVKTVASKTVESEMRRSVPGIHHLPPLTGFGRQVGHTGPGVAELQKSADALSLMYEYGPRVDSNTARLVVLKQRIEADEAIYVHLLQVPFVDLASYRYEALSYDGSAGEPSKTIFLEDLYTQRPADPARALLGKRIRVKPNLYSALYHLRSWKKDLKIWVDALCINQGDHIEKTAQVARMSEIYWKAKRVLVWLGPPEPTTARAMRFLHTVSQPEMIAYLIRDETEVRMWEDVLHMLRWDWFSRRWAIQELACGREATVHCGGDSIDWQDLVVGVSVLSDNFDSIRNMLNLGVDSNSTGKSEALTAKTLIEIINSIFREQHTEDPNDREPVQSLEYLVSVSTAYDASDPRDTINCFRNIVRETYNSNKPGIPAIYANLKPPEPNYEHDLLKVYTDFIEWIYKTTGCIDILCRRWALPETRVGNAPQDYPALSELPSWIRTVDEHRFRRRYEYSFVGMPGRGPYNACKSQRADVRFGRDDANLVVPVLHGLGPSSGRETRRPSSIGRFQVSSLPPSNLSRNWERRREQSPETSGAPKSPYGVKDAILTMGSLALHEDVSGTQSFPAPTIFPVNADSSAMESLRSNERLALYAAGLLVGRITWSTDSTTDGIVPAHALHKLFDTSHDPYKDVSEVEVVPDKMWRTLIAERGFNGEHTPVLSQTACRYVLRHTSVKGYIDTNELLRGELPEMVRTYLKRVQEVIWNRCFIEAQPEGISLGTNKRHGLGPSDSQFGDIVCILYGCTVPCLLRECADSPGSYRLIGECYVYGLMDGRAVTCRSEEVLERDKVVFRIV